MKLINKATGKPASPALQRKIYTDMASSSNPLMSAYGRKGVRENSTVSNTVSQANRGSVGSVGKRSSNPGIAGQSRAGIVGAVNPEIQNDDVVLPYQKVNL